METSHTTTVTDQIYNAVDTTFTSFLLLFELH